MEITEKSILKHIQEKAKRPMKVAEMIRFFSVPDSKRREFRQIVKDLAFSGSLERTRGGRFCSPDQKSLLPGIVQCRPNGNGFFIPEAGGEDAFIGRAHMKGAMHLDKVLVRLKPGRKFGRPDGVVERIIERNTKELIGTFETSDGEGWVIPSESKYYYPFIIPKRWRSGAKNGQLVNVEITEYPTNRFNPSGQITEVFGYALDPEAEARAILRKHRVLLEFSQGSEFEAENFSEELSEEDLEGREDLRDWTLFTIDGETAKDFDDAVSIEITSKGYTLGVHIADVGHFVKENSALDKDALERGTSVYYANGVVPMLPFPLSSNLCSLKPDVERLAMTVLMEMDDNGVMRSYKIFPSVIKSKRRLTYTEAYRLMKEGDEEGGYGKVYPALQKMAKLALILKKNRIGEGSVEFDIPESQITLAKNGKVQSIGVTERNAAHELIEEFMLSANRAVARFLDKNRLPGLNRYHESPNAEKLEGVSLFLQSQGEEFEFGQNIRQKDLQTILKRTVDKPFSRPLNYLLLRTMKKAEYSSVNSGHFCLGFDHYVHFTSPIRRYPDLAVHRIVKDFLNGEINDKARSKLREKTLVWAQQSSVRERKAMEAERDIQDLRRAQFMVDKVGQRFEGYISSVMAFGFFVELIDPYVEGLVKMGSLTDDYYVFYETEHKLKGQYKKKTFQIGDSVNVKLSRVDLSQRQIEFVIPGLAEAY